MRRKKIIESLPASYSPHVLIIGGEKIALKLDTRLTENGCVVKKESHSYAPLAGKYDYIFQFGDFATSLTRKQNNLLPGGKFLFIDVDSEDIEEVEAMRILRTGQLDFWDEEKLLQTVLRLMFSLSSGPIVDVRKAVLKKTTPKSSEATLIHELPHVSKSDVALLSPAHPSSAKKHIPDVVRKTRFPFGWKGGIFGLFLLFLFVLIGLTGWYVMQAHRIYLSFRDHVETSKWELAVEDIRNARSLLAVGKQVYSLTSGPLFFLESWEPYQNVGTFFETGDLLLSTSHDIITTSIAISNEGKSGFGGISPSNYKMLKDKILKLSKTLVDAHKQVERVSFPGFPKEDMTTLLTRSSEKLTAALSIMPFLEEVFFRPEARTYLLLFQNNMELRPTGGFIGSYALVIVKGGEISSFTIEDVYAADGQLKGHVDPPNAIRKYLNQPHYYLRDSNFDPDFAVSGAKAAWFLQQEIGVKVDGVIAINSTFLQKLLTVTGGLTLSDFAGEEVTSENFFLKSYSLVQGNFFPGSTQKKDFLTAVSQGLRFRIEHDPSLWLDLLPVIKESLEDKHIQLYSFDETFQKYIEEQGYGGRMSQIQCLTVPVQENIPVEKSCLADYLAIIEANLGVNKANYFINKSVSIEKRISPSGEIKTDLTLSYENANIPEVYSSGTYVNYLRIFLPIGSTVDSVSVNTSSIARENLDVENYGTDKVSIGTLVNIAPTNKAILKISYSHPSLLDAKRDSYQFLFQKQSGDKLSPLVLSLHYPDGKAVTALNFTSSGGRKNEIYYTTDTSVDRIFAFGTK
ncbi:DUF4012 domain-containing protein [Candidatus Gottesmanbacteria bacterium]|nr:DUF4012 domain-containing protein [Candidatus Gottesmanbacteria bacterium]